MRSLSLAPLLVASMSPAPLYGQAPMTPPAHATTAVGKPASQTVHPGETLPAASAPGPSSPPTTATALDTLGGHLALTAGAGLAVPFGRLRSRLPQSRRIGPGLALTLSATYGLSHTLAVGIWGDRQSWSKGSACNSCSAAGFAGGALAVYHIVQGVRFDPWLAAGLGWRTLTVDSDLSDATYSGPELLRLLVGGDWYATRLLGLGPTLELAAGTYTDRPSEPGTGRAYYWQFQTTLRIALDLPGK